MILQSSSENDTITIATRFTATLKSGDCVLLTGDLGMGKSIFCRAIIRALTGVSDLNVPSPTFTLTQIYETPLGDVWHFDLYRLKSPEELYEIGWEEARSGGICLIEWPDRLGYLKPRKTISVNIQSGTSPDNRIIGVTRHDD